MGTNRGDLILGAGVDTIAPHDGRSDKIDGGRGTDRAYYDTALDWVRSIEIR